MQKQHKYCINKKLNELSVTDYKKTLKFLPVQLGISTSSFNKYRSIKVGAAQDIPHTIVAKLEQFFGIKPGELQNFTTEMRPLSEIDDKESIAGKYQLEKI